MATIITHPEPLSLSSNLRRFEIAASSETRFILSQGESVLIDESYHPNPDGRIIIDVKEVVNANLSTQLPSGDIFLQTGICKPFKADIGGQIVEFSAIKAGVENPSETPGLFLSANWLTWQPQSKKVTYNQPEWLTYYAVINAVIKVRFHLKDGSPVIHTLHNIPAGACYTYNMQFAHVMTLVEGDKYGYYDVYAEDTSGNRLTYIQRYVYKQEESNDEYFIFINSLGGIDTANLTGESRFSPEIEHVEGVYDDVSCQVPGKSIRKFEKNSGWLAKNEAAWLFDLLNSHFRYILSNGTLKRITVFESSVDDTSQEDMKSIILTYRMANDTGLLNISRTMDPLPENLELDTPADGLFFLAPRLVDFETVAPDDNLLFPVQTPFLQKWFKLSWGAIWNFLYNKLLASAIGIMAHVHDNLSVINKLSEDGGSLLYGGAPIGGSGSGTGVQLGETSQTAYRGDRGKVAYDHSQNNDIHIGDAPSDGQSYARNSKEWVTLPSSGGPAVRLSTNNQVFEYDENGNITDPYAFAWIYTTLFNIPAGMLYFEWIENGVTIQNSTSGVLQYLPPLTFSSPEVIRVYVRIGSPSSSIIAFDTITMYGIKPGSDGKDAYTVVLSNPAHAFPANKDGVITDYSGSGTDIRVWKGITPIPYGAGAMTFNVSATGYNINVGTVATISTYTRRYYNSSNMVAVTARIEFTVSVRDDNNNQIDFIQVLSYTISKEGQPGTDGTPGVAGPSLVFMGEYDPVVTYVGNSRRIDMVKYTANGKYYAALKTAGTFSGKAPIDSQYWEIADGQFKFVATELLFAESTYVRNLIAEQLKTAITGRRVEINAGDKQQIAIYDNLNALKVLIKPEPISTMSVIESGSATAYHNSYADTTVKSSNWSSPNFGPISYAQVSSQFEVNLEGNLEIEIGYISISAGRQNGTYAQATAYVYVVLEKYSGGVWNYVDVIGSCSEMETSKVITKTVKGLTSGSYRLAAYHEHFSWTDWIPGMPAIQDNCSAYSAWSYYSGGSFNITVRRVIAQTEMGTDGIASVWATNKYFHFSQAGLFVKMGTKTLEVSETGVKINGIIHN
ncbi:MAG: hypothetical protein AB9922_12385 [Bacteroidales bacterium]